MKHHRHLQPWIQKLSVLLVISVLFAGTSIPVFADSYPDGAPVIGPFRYDAEYAASIAEKERIALQELQEQEAMGRSATGKILSISQVPQETNYWCGYAAMKSCLDYEGISKTQTQIADETYKTSSSLAWYTIDGEATEQFPAAVAMHNYTGWGYRPFPFGTAGATPITAYDVEWRVKNTINNNHGVLVCGQSRGSSSGHPSILPGYPADNIGHWIGVKGYSSNASTIWVVDPAKSDAVGWSGSIDAQYSITSAKLAAFAQARGIIW